MVITHVHMHMLAFIDAKNVKTPVPKSQNFRKNILDMNWIGFTELYLKAIHHLLVKRLPYSISKLVIWVFLEIL